MTLSVDKAIHKARSHLKAGELTEAEVLYKQVLSKFPKNKKAIQGYQELKIRTAAKTASTAEPPQQQIQELINLYQQGQFEDVLSKAELLISLFSKAIVLYNLIGASNAALQRYDAAIENYKQAIKMKPDDALSYSNMGNALKDKGDLAGAIDSYEQAIKMKPDHADAYYNMGLVIQGNGELDTAIENYEQAIKIKPDFAQAYYNMGTAQKNKGDLAAAIDSYEQTIKIKPDHAKAYNNLGAALQDKGEIIAAIENYEQAIKIKPDYSEAYYNLGIALKHKGDLNAAIESYEQVLRLAPDNADAKHLLASLSGETTNSAPRSYVENLFDGYASKFEHSLVKKLEYFVPKKLTEMLVINHTTASMGSVLDLGCGTGLAGVELRQFSVNLEGVDLSKAMIEHAQEKNIYNRLTHSDIVEYLSTEDLDFDCFVATDVFIYVGDLTDVFRLIKTRNKRGGKMAFSTEHSEKEGFFLETSGRYSHSKAYIENLSNKYDYRLSYFSKTDLRKEKDKFLIGGLYLLEF